MPTTLERWRKVHEIFDPIEPASAELRVNRQYNPLSEKIIPRLKLRLGHQKFVLAGGVGSGKSTELRANVEGLGDARLVVLVDLWRHFESTVEDAGAIDHLQPAELVGLLGLAILRTGTDILGHKWRDLEQRLGSAISAIQPSSTDDNKGLKFDVVALSKGIAVFVGGAVGAIAGPVGALAGAGVVKATVEGGLQLLDSVSESATWEWKVGLRGRKRSSDQDAPVRAVLQATNALLDDIRTHYKRDIVLLVDGLDRVQDATTFEDLFVESGLLGDLRCDLITTLQLGLVQKYRARLHWCNTYDFTYVPVVLQNDPSQPNAKGMEFFESLAKQRFKKLGGEAPVSAEFIRQLACKSGGRLRDFISLVREVSIQAMLEDAPHATSTHILRAIDQLRRDRESGLNTEHIRVLVALLSDPQHSLPAGDIALDLLDRQLLLAYPNESTWYLPHTILMPLLNRAGASASA